MSNGDEVFIFMGFPGQINEVLRIEMLKVFAHVTLGQSVYWLVATLTAKLFRF